TGNRVTATQSVATDHVHRDVDVVRAGEVSRRADERVVVEHVHDTGDRLHHIVVADLGLLVAPVAAVALTPTTTAPTAATAASAVLFTLVVAGAVVTALVLTAALVLVTVLVPVTLLLITPLVATVLLAGVLVPAGILMRAARPLVAA